MKRPSIVVFLLIMSLLAVFFFKSLFFTAKQTEAKVNLSAVHEVQANHRREFRIFAENVRGLWTQKSGARYEYYLSEAELPDNVRRALPPEHIPYASKDGFLALAWPKDEREPRTYWVIDEKKRLRSFDSLPPSK